MSWHTCLQLSFWSSFSSLGTIFAHTFCMPKCFVIMFQTLSFFMFSWLAIIQTVNQHLPHTTCFICLMLTSVLLVESLLLLESFFISFCLFLNLLCYSKMCVQHGIISIHSLKYFKCLWWSFHQLDKKFQFYTLLSVHHLFLSTQSWTTWKRYVNKSMLKMQ